jgi:hypothetical protein
MTPRQRRWIFLVAGTGLVAFYLWGLSGLPGFWRGVAVSIGFTGWTLVIARLNEAYRPAGVVRHP